MKKGTNPLEEMKQTVLEQELSARSWKAYYEKMYYSLESEKLQPEYEAYQKRISQKMEEEKKASEMKMKEFAEKSDIPEPLILTEKDI